MMRKDIEVAIKQVKGVREYFYASEQEFNLDDDVKFPVGIHHFQFNTKMERSKTNYFKQSATVAISFFDKVNLDDTDTKKQKVIDKMYLLGVQVINNLNSFDKYEPIVSVSVDNFRDKYDVMVAGCTFRFELRSTIPYSNCACRKGLDCGC